MAKATPPSPLPLPSIENLGSWPSGAVGYVALLGRPNAGKSTLLNTVLEHRITAVSSKPQTTRRRWMGICCGDTYQMLFLDTPGVHVPKLALGEAMATSVGKAVADADVVLVLADALRPQREEDELVAQTAAKTGKPVVLAINKCDDARAEQIEAAEAFYRQRLGDNVPVFRIAGRDRATLDALLAGLRERLPTGPFLYDPDELTDASGRAIGAELIRETVMTILREEVPHAIAVTIESWDETDDGCDVRAVLHVEKPSQKPIVVGSKGRTIARIREQSQKRLAETFGNVNLSLWVKVTHNWRKRQGTVRELLNG